MQSLRPYQQAAIEATYNHLRLRDDNPCIVLPTGTGKSHCLAKIASDAVNLWQGRVLILAHVKELLEQNAEKVALYAPDIDVGIYSAGLKRRDTDNPVIVAGIQSVYKRSCELGKFDLVIIDEAHLIPPSGDGMYRKFLADALVINPNLRVIGLTATPYRLKGGLICKPENILNHVCYEAGIKEMIAQGYLANLKSRSGKVKADLNNLHIRGGEFIASEMEAAMDEKSLVRQACYEIVELTRERNSVLIFTTSVAHCEHVAAEIARLTGKECGIVTGETPADKRAEILARFKGEAIKSDLFHEKPRLKFLANVNVLTTGFDATNIDCVVLLRPTASVGLYVQMVGRGTRLHEGKDDCLILDYGGNVLRHGPVDAVCVEEKSQSKFAGEPAAKECPQCCALIHAGYASCPECGYRFPEQENETLTANADSAAILSGEISDIEYDVRSTYYQPWEKKDRTTGEILSRTMRVDYQTGFGLSKSEWVCPEHTGWARKKFEQWWSKRCDMPAPATVEEAIEIAEAGGLAEPTQITVRSVSGEKFDRIIDYELAEIPPRLDGEDEYYQEADLPEYSWAGDEIPF